MGNIICMTADVAKGLICLVLFALSVIVIVIGLGLTLAMAADHAHDDRKYYD